MRITIAAVGRWKAGRERALYETYARRINWPLTLKEIAEARDRQPRDAKQREAKGLLGAVDGKARRVALDAGGRALDSNAFARLLDGWQTEALSEIAFFIGGADGLDGDLLAHAHDRLSLGAMTWPHLLVRVQLAEQIYRAQCILAGHPYHRG